MTKTIAETYGYATVEAALSKFFKTDDKTLLSLRGRIKAFQRAGLTPESPGRGKVIKYNINDIYNWAFALSLQDFGMPTELAVSMASNDVFGRQLLSEIIKSDEHIFFHFVPFLFKAKEHDKNVFFTSKASHISSESITNAGGRVAFIDLTALKNQVDYFVAEAAASKNKGMVDAYHARFPNAGRLK